MRKTLIALATLFAATTAHAVDLAPGLSLDTEVKAWHEVDAEKNYLTINPEVEWTPTVDGALSLSVGTVITAYETATTGDSFILFDALDEGSRPNIDFGAEYDLGNGAELFGETSWDVDNSERTEMKVGVSFTF
jgi:hypothetical protein